MTIKHVRDPVVRVIVRPRSSGRVAAVSATSPLPAFTMAPPGIVLPGTPTEEGLMPGTTNAPILRSTAILLVAILLASCSAKPVSQVTSSQAAPAPASVAPASETPGSTDPPPDGSPAATAEATPAPTPGVPSKPGNPTFEKVGRQSIAGGGARETYRITWSAPEGVATAFLVYGVTRCLRESKEFDGKPCVVKGMKIPKNTLRLLGQAPGPARSIDVTWKTGEVGPGPYAAVLIRATNDAGDSIFTIVHSDDVCWRCTY